MIRRWHDLLGRTMWDFPGGRTGGDRYLVLGLGPAAGAEPALPADTGELIAYGTLLSDDGTARLGTAALVRAAGRDEARAVLEPHTYDAVEVHDWAFGGRPA